MSRGKSDKIVYKEYNQSSKYTSVWKKAVEKNDAKPDENLRKSYFFKENCGKEK